jgi:hypothetical protein
MHFLCMRGMSGTLTSLQVETSPTCLNPGYYSTTLHSTTTTRNHYNTYYVYKYAVDSIFAIPTTQQSNDTYALPGPLSPLLANSISILFTSQGLTLQVKRSKVKKSVTDLARSNGLLWLHWRISSVHLLRNMHVPTSASRWCWGSIYSVSISCSAFLCPPPLQLVREPCSLTLYFTSLLSTLYSLLSNVPLSLSLSSTGVGTSFQTSGFKSCKRLVQSLSILALQPVLGASFERHPLRWGGPVRVCVCSSHGCCDKFNTGIDTWRG